jgi:RNA polymerase sigma-70 factor (ECF subfamily)
MNEKETRALFASARSGDKQAFGIIYKEYFTPVFRYLYLKTGNRENAEDLTQTVFLKIYLAMDRFKNVKGKSVLAYFFTIARNSFIDFSRKRREVPAGLVEEIGAIEQKDLLAQIDDRYKLEKIKKTIEKLDKLQKEVIIMKFFSQLENREIADILGKSEATIRKIQSRALSKIRELL